MSRAPLKKMKLKTIHLGYEISSGEPVEIPLRHLAVTGQTQDSGKTTTLEALISRSELKAIAFVTKRGERSFQTTRTSLPPYFRERADWQFVSSILEATFREKMKFERSWKRRPHGHMMRYLAGCRCRRCHLGNVKYKRKLDENRRLYGPNDLVLTDRVLEHLKYLKQFGIGHKTVAKHAKVAKTGLAEIIWYGKKQMRRRNEARVLAIQPTLDTLPRNVSIPATETVEKLRQLIRWGYPKSLINRDAFNLQTVGLQVHALEGKKETVLVKTAIRVRDFFARIEAIRQVWLSRRGSIPQGHFVYWKTQKHGCRLNQLELRPVSTGYYFHHVYPPELKSAIRLANQLKRLCRTKGRYEKHNHRSAQPSIRNAGGAERRREANGDRASEGSLLRRQTANRIRKGGGQVPGGHRRIPYQQLFGRGRAGQKEAISQRGGRFVVRAQ